ncbi:MAG: hypothetical protein L3V56_14970 [Candidatus Magnetoovum sp. WYHC-5]|nr:hypothetical protein [Candidatus Magnetoovum sp. WYHC-5]
MKKCYSLLLIVVTMVFVFNIVCLADSGKVVNDDNGHTYMRIDEDVDWCTAKEYCEELGGYLATVTSEQENKFIYDNLVKSVHKEHSCWLGGTDEGSEGTWYWITGETWNYTSWDEGQPDDARGAEDYLMYYSPYDDYTWNDCDNNIYSGTYPCLGYAICEWDSLDTGSCGKAKYDESSGVLSIPCVEFGDGVLYEIELSSPFYINSIKKKESYSTGNMQIIGGRNSCMKK